MEKKEKIYYQMPLLKRWKQWWICVLKEGHEDVCRFSAERVGHGCYDSLFICKKCRRGKWVETTNWIEHDLNL